MATDGLIGMNSIEFVRDDHPRDVSQPFEQLAEKLLRSFLVSPTLHQDVEHVPVLIHRSPQVMPFAVDGQKHLVQGPLVARPGPSANKFICHVRLKRSGPWWYVANAHQMLALRCAKYNGTFDQVFARYRQRIQEQS